MKTKNNVQKAILRSAAVVISFILLSFTVSAQEFWKRLITHSSFNEIAIAMIETSDKSEVPTETNSESDFSFSMIQDYDNELNLEDWMTNDFYFETLQFQLSNEMENSLELEEWMLNENNFSSEQVEEESLELESWMTSDEVWNS